MSSWGESLSPGNEQREYWGSQAAEQAGSRNIIGIKNPAIDTLIERVIFAKDRDELVAATKALDRVLLWNHYVVPQWTYPQVAHRALGPLRPAGRTAEIRPVGLSRRSGGATPRRRPGSASGLEGLRAWRSSLAGMCSVSASARWPRRGCGRLRAAESGTEAHGMSAFGDLKYPAGLPSFRLRQSERAEGRTVFADPARPRLQPVVPTFNSLNAYILKGDAAQGMELTFASLMARAGDEPDAMYGLAAKSCAISADGLTYRFTLRPEARFHDGTKLTAHDAAFSLNDAEEQGPSDHHAADARHAEGAKPPTTRRWW